MTNLFNLDINKIRYGGLDVKLIKLGSNIVYEAKPEQKEEDFYVQYTVDYTFDNYRLIDKGLPYIYTDNGNGVDRYTDIIIIKKDDTITKDVSISLGDVKSVIVYYPMTASSIQFGGTYISDINNSRFMSPIKSIDYVNVSNFSSMGSMFTLLENIIAIDTTYWDTSNVTNMSNMFSSCDNLTLINASNWDVSKVTNMSYMFSGCSRLYSIGDVSNWDTSNVTTMESMFSSCVLELDLSSWDTSKVTNMGAMFNYYNAPELDLRNLDVSNVTDMRNMFSGCSSQIKLDNWVTTNVTNMQSMFSSITLSELDLSHWDVSKATNMSFMFYNCESLTTLDLSGWSISSLSNTASMFERCRSLHELYLDDCDRSTISKIINSSYFPTNALSGVTRTIYCNEKNVTGLTPPNNWEFGYID